MTQRVLRNNDKQLNYSPLPFMARPVLSFLLACTLVAQHVRAYTVPVLDTGKPATSGSFQLHQLISWVIDYSRQTCSGMWASDSTFINGMLLASILAHLCLFFFSYIRRKLARTGGHGDL